MGWPRNIAGTCSASPRGVPGDQAVHPAGPVAIAAALLGLSFPGANCTPSASRWAKAKPVDGPVVAGARPRRHRRTARTDTALRPRRFAGEPSRRGRRCRQSLPRRGIRWRTRPDTSRVAGGTRRSATNRPACGLHRRRRAVPRPSGCIAPSRGLKYTFRPKRWVMLTRHLSLPSRRVAAQAGAAVAQRRGTAAPAITSLADALDFERLPETSGSRFGY